MERQCNLPRKNTEKHGEWTTEMKKPGEQFERTTISNLTPVFQFMIDGGFTLTGEDLEIIMTIIIHKEIAHGRITNNFTCHESQKRTS
jgi:hypothetical protein